MSIDAVTAMGIALGVVGGGWLQAEWRLMLAKECAGVNSALIDFWKERGDAYRDKLLALEPLGVATGVTVTSPLDELAIKSALNEALADGAIKGAGSTPKPRRRANPVSVNQ